MLEEDDEDDVVMENPLVDLLVTEDGDNIADGIVKALDRIGRQMDAQNKILIKLYSALTKIGGGPAAAPA